MCECESYFIVSLRKLVQKLLYKHVIELSNKSEEVRMKRVLFIILFISLFIHIEMYAQVEVVELSDTIWCQYPYVMPFDNGSKIMVVWSEGNTLSDSIYMRIHENGQWGPKTAVINSGNKSQYPQLDIDSNGTIHMTWMEGVGGGRDIYYAKYQNGSWSAMSPVYVSDSRNSTWPSISVDMDNIVHVTWSHDYQIYSNATDNDVWHRFKPVDSSSWSGPLNVSNWRFTTSYHPVLGTSGSKQYCAWMQGVDGSWSVYFSERTNGSSWTPIQNIQGGGTWPAITADPAGNPHVLINMADGTLYYRNRINGTWSGPQTLNTYARKKNFVTIQADQSNRLFAAWRQGPGGAPDQENTARIFFAKGDQSGNWEDPELVHVGLVTKHPVLNPDNSGYVHLVWFDTGYNPTSGHAGYEYGKVFYAKLEAGNSIRILAPNGGEYWRIGEEHTLSWETNVPDGAPAIDYVKIEYSTNGGSSFNTLQDAVPNTGSVTGVIPRDQVSASNQCLFRISDVNGTCSDISDSVFTLLPPASENGYSFKYDGSWTSAGYGLAEDGWFPGDYNGDGNDDLFRYYPYGLNMLLSDQNKFYGDGNWTPAGIGLATFYVGDYNGDGRKDLFRHYPPGINMMLSSGHNFYANGNWTPAGYGTDGWYKGDFDGDGKTDLMRYIAGTGSQVLLSTGSKFTDGGIWTPAGNGTDGWYIGDFNGDGRSDVMRFVPGVGSQVMPSSGRNFTFGGTWTVAGTGSDGWYIGDFDGDGMDDIFRYLPGLSGADVFLSDGTKFVYDGTWTLAGKGIRDWYIGDFNGDGRDDIFRYLPGVSGAEMFLASGGTAAGASFIQSNQNSPSYRTDDRKTPENINAMIDISRVKLSMEEGEKFLAPFIKMAESGHMPTFYRIHKAYEQHLGKKVRDVAVYRLLHRHKWEERVARYYRDNLTHEQELEKNRK